MRRNKINFELIDDEAWASANLSQYSYPDNRKIVLHVAEFLGMERAVLLNKAHQLPTLSNRMEVFEGLYNNLIINDSYNIDIDALEQALSYQFPRMSDKIKLLCWTCLLSMKKEKLQS